MGREFLPNPFDQPGNWYRGCLHVHTTESDGAMSPEALLEHYQMGGFDFVAITDHDRLTDRVSLSSSDFLVLRGTEFVVGRTELGQGYHVVALGLKSPLNREQFGTPQLAIDAIGEAGGEAIIAHPYWSGLTVADLLALRGYLAIEVFNTGCEVGVGRGQSEVWWDEMLTRGKVVPAVAVDDSHWPGFDSLCAWVMVRATELTEEAIMVALRKWHYYSSTGPQIESVTVRDGGRSVEVRCSPVETIGLVCDPTRGLSLGAGRYGIGRRARHVWGDRPWREGIADGEPITGAVFELSGNETYARVQITDRRGGRAWSNPLFVCREQ